MLRSWYIGVAVALAFTTASALADEGVSQKALEQQQKELLQKLTQVQNDIVSLKSRVDKLESNHAAVGDVADLQFKIDNLREEIRTLRSELGKSTTEARRMPLGPGMPPPLDMNRIEARKAAGGTLRLVNEYPLIQQVNVNGLPYTLAPGQSLDVTVPPGSFNYQVIGYHPLPREKTLAAGKVFTVVIHP